MEDIMALAIEMRPIVDFIRIFPAENSDMTLSRPELFDMSIPTAKYCTSPDYYMGILWNGDVVPCCRDIGTKTILGNVFEDGILDVFNNSRYASLREACHDNLHEPTHRCMNCNVWKQKIGMILRRE
jgi:radical SAM protein with 4Fe4S-binding SPASM domain